MNTYEIFTVDDNGAKKRTELKAYDFYCKDGFVYFTGEKDPRSGYSDKVAAFQYGTVLCIKRI